MKNLVFCALIMLFFCSYKTSNFDSIKIILVNEEDTILFERIDSTKYYNVVINQCLPGIMNHLQKIKFKDNIKSIGLKDVLENKNYIENILTKMSSFKNLYFLSIDGLTSNAQNPILLKNLRRLQYFHIRNIDFTNDSLFYYLSFSDSIKQISIEYSNLKSIILRKGSLKNLNKLYISNTNISKMNYGLFCLPEITSLELEKNRIKRFDKKKIKCKSWDSAKHLLKHSYPN